jgi:hypothetical protein
MTTIASLLVFQNRRVRSLRYRLSAHDNDTDYLRKAEIQAHGEESIVAGKHRRTRREGGLGGETSDHVNSALWTSIVGSF